MEYEEQGKPWHVEHDQAGNAPEVLLGGGPMVGGLSCYAVIFILSFSSVALNIMKIPL